MRRKSINTFLTGLVLVGTIGCDYKKLETETKSHAIEKISIVCKGNSITENAAGLKVASETIETYIFEAKGDELIITRNGRSRAIKNNFVHQIDDQPGKPLYIKSWKINEDIIQVLDRLTISDDGVNSEQEFDDRLTINRISGKWSHEDSHKTVSKSNKISSYEIYSHGICEKQEQKF